MGGGKLLICQLAHSAPIHAFIYQGSARLQQFREIEIGKCMCPETGQFRASKR